MTDSNKGGLRKDGTSRRTRAGRSGHGGLPRVMILAVIVIVAGAAVLFWPRGGSVPTGIGENQTVVTASDTTEREGIPRSGEVDIGAETVPLTPEKAENTPAKTPAPVVEKKTAAPVKTVVKESPPPAVKPKPAPVKRTLVKPVDNGPYGIQTGAFGDAANAEKEVARLKAKGWTAKLRAGNNSKGDMVYRVWVVYFKTRDNAQTFINQHPRDLAGAITVHR